MISGIVESDRERAPREIGRTSNGIGLVGAEFPGDRLELPTFLIANLPYETSPNGVSKPGVLGTDVGAVEYPTPDI